MKWGVNKKTLLLIAGVVWMIAGINILRIGIVTWMDSSQKWLFQIAEAVVVFLLFFLFIFRRLYKKYTLRIDRQEGLRCPFSFFDTKGWVMMIFMITLGILVRKFHWLPDAFISVFYVGLSVALIMTGWLFIRHYNNY